MKNKIKKHFKAMKKGLEKGQPICLNCGGKFKPVYDKITKERIEHIWHCDCMPENINISIG